jgi:hypothetical protein
VRNIIDTQMHKGVGLEKEREQEKGAKKGKFRHNKYEVYSSAQLEHAEPAREAQAVSDSRLELDKKGSNVSINKEMDKLALRQMQQYQLIRNKEFHRSVDTSNEKYFSFESYRPAKSKNDIEGTLSATQSSSVLPRLPPSTRSPTPPPTGPSPSRPTSTTSASRRRRSRG